MLHDLNSKRFSVHHFFRQQFPTVSIFKLRQFWIIFLLVLSISEVAWFCGAFLAFRQPFSLEEIYRIALVLIPYAFLVSLCLFFRTFFFYLLLLLFPFLLIVLEANNMFYCHEINDMEFYPTDRRKLLLDLMTVSPAYAYMLICFLGIMIRLLGSLFGRRDKARCIFLKMFSAGFQLAVIIIPLVLIIRILCIRGPFNIDTGIAVLQTDGIPEALAYLWTQKMFTLLSLVFLAVLLLPCLFAKMNHAVCSLKHISLRLLLTGCVCGGILFFTSYGDWGVPVIIGKSFAYFKDHRKFLEKRALHQSEVTEEIRRKVQTTQTPDTTFVFCIGDSARRDYMGCFGYAKDTTPYLTSQLQNPGFVFFPNVYSCHAASVQCCHLIFTQYNQYQYNDYPIEKAISVLDVAHHLNMKLSWLSNQFPETFATHVFSSIAEPVYFNSTRAFLIYRFHYDDVVIQPFFKLLEEPRSQFIVLHLWGNHAPYASRVPATFQCPGKATDYERTMFYVDHLLKQMCQKIEAQERPVIFLYTSDHAEDFRFNGHDPARFSIEQTYIPMILYLNSAYRKAHPDMVKRLHQIKDRVFTNDLLYNFTLSLLNIPNTFTPPGLDILSPEYSITKDSALTLWGTRKINGESGRLKRKALKNFYSY